MLIPVDKFEVLEAVTLFLQQEAHEEDPITVSQMQRLEDIIVKGKAILSYVLLDDVEYEYLEKYLNKTAYLNVDGN